MGEVTILFASYRSWADKARKELAEIPGVTLLDRRTLEAVDDTIDPLVKMESVKIDAAFYCGWSWYVPNVSEVPSYCLHPSPLPRYRGGSPLQHQIIQGETSSKATIFRMTEELDAGPIVLQSHLSLEGSLDRILAELSSCAAVMFSALSQQLVAGEEIEERLQEGEPSVWKRRRPFESEITPEELASSSALEISNKVRALAHPDYPNAYIQCADGKKLRLLEVDV